MTEEMQIDEPIVKPAPEESMVTVGRENATVPSSVAMPVSDLLGRVAELEIEVAQLKLEVVTLRRGSAYTN